ncbi:MAG: HPr(Ser) kinase/phosphatase [Parasporobacterium sp.]|nr:HPr(Ser) kinase/phosphatase [Parasporobacterium sp.]
MSEKSVTIQQLTDALGYENLTPWIDLTRIRLDQRSINRPAFQLAGFFDYFDNGRLQITGLAESQYMNRLTSAERIERYDKLFALGFPAIVSARGIIPHPESLDAARKYGIPILKAQDETGKVIVDVVTWLSEQMAPMETRHGVLVDVFGEGILITGNTGIGKSETAIELIKRGQRLVADDLVEIHKTNEFRLIGSAPELTKHFVELRGIGVVDIKSLYGVESVKEQQAIDMIVNLEVWDGNNSYDRLGLEEEYEEILGVKVVRHNVPVRPGRNLAIIIETAAVNNRQKKMGYNAAHELVDRVRQEVRRKNIE